MEEFELQELEKVQSKLALEVFGPSGSGKTTGLIKLAMGIRNVLYPGVALKDICCFVDTENGSSSKAVGRCVGGETLESTMFYDFKAPYDIYKLVKLIDFLNKKGFKIVIIDSYSAFWSGTSGILERASELEVELSSAGKLKQYGAWSEKEMINKKNILKNLIISSGMHVLLGMRAKTEYVMELNSRGKNVPRAVGVKEDMQADVRYEPDIVVSIDKETHGMKVVKDRLGFDEIRQAGMEDDDLKPITVADGELLAQLISEGVSPEDVAKRKIAAMKKFILDEKSHKATKVAQMEVALKAELTPEMLDKLPVEKLVKIYEFIK